MIQRVFNTKPGYDCRVECNHEMKGQHGIHGDEWIYAVVDRDAQAALELTVYTPRYPKTVTNADNKIFSGAYLALHLGFPISQGQVQHSASHSASHPNCAYIGTCFNGGTWSLLADELVVANFDQNGDQEQPKLWTALEAELTRCVQRAEEQRRKDGDLKWVRCTHCHGEGVIER